MDHWFDRLSRPYTRRTMLKAGAVAGAALLLPASRVPKAWATSGEPCFKPCTDAAAKDFSSTRNGLCKALAGPQLFGSLLLGFPSPLAGAVLLQGAFKFTDCLSNAELGWHKAVEACRGSECGNPGRYPGGQAPRNPPPKCDPVAEIVCGNICCDIVAAQCCPCSTVDGGYICCASNANCDCCPKN